LEASADKLPQPADETGALNGATPDRIVDAGIKLFAERGFQGTTVGEIERAAGLTPRAGALYKHFPSKEAVLEAAFERNVAELETLHSAIELMPLGDLRAELTLLVRFGLQMLGRERALRRIVITEGDRFPELKKRYREAIVDRAYDEVITFIRLKMANGEFPESDAEALAALLVGALLGYSVEFDVFGRYPAGVDEDRIVAVAVESCMAMVESARLRAAGD
jgi:AcrR family transcriptional regulator